MEEEVQAPKIVTQTRVQRQYVPPSACCVHPCFMSQEGQQVEQTVAAVPVPMTQEQAVGDAFAP